MSKQARAKEAQGYTTEKHNCGNCANHVFDLEFRGYYKRCVERDGPGSRYDNDRYKEPCRHRCGIGGFSIQITATCEKWQAKPATKD